MFNRFIVLVTLAAFTGALIGWLAPSVQAITASYTIRNQPGSPLDTGKLACGWHASGCPTTGNEALDWDDYGGLTVNWRSWVYHQYASPNSLVAYGYSEQSNYTCTRARVRIVHYLSGQAMGTVYYTHSQSNGARVNILGSSSWSYTGATPVATMVTSEVPGCPWTGINVHQADNANHWSENTGYPTASQCTLCYTPYNVTSFSNYQFVRSSIVQY